jgi:putative FmdB family regulatory protein
VDFFIGILSDAQLEHVHSLHTGGRVLHTEYSSEVRSSFQTEQKRIQINHKKYIRNTMPLFEYRCNECNNDYEILHPTRENTNLVECPQCHSKEYHKKFSTFSAVMSVPGYSSSPCAGGACDVPSYSPCANGMCGLN